MSDDEALHEAEVELLRLVPDGEFGHPAGVG
jgi:hypothetical protein